MLTTDNFILIEGGSYEKVKKALRKWIEMYSKDLDTKVTLCLSRNEKKGYIIQVDKELDNDRFYYLVNYLKYPIDIDYDIDVIGYTKGKQNNQLKNKDLQVYIDENYRNGDNVNVTTQDNEGYKIDFGGNITRIHDNVEFKKRSIPKLTDPEILKNKINKIQRNKDSKTNKRFRVIGSIIGMFYVLLILILYLNWQTAFFVKSLWFLNIGVALWFFTDYELLRDNVKYLLSIIIAISIIPYSLLIISEFGIDSFYTSKSSSLHALVLLIIQWPLRRIFLKVFKVEPEVDRTGNVQNFTYTFILAIGMMIIPFIIEDLLNK